MVIFHGYVGLPEGNQFYGPWPGPPAKPSSANMSPSPDLQAIHLWCPRWSPQRFLPAETHQRNRISEQICVDNPSTSCTHQLYQLSNWQSAYHREIDVLIIFWSSQTSHDFSGFRWHPGTPFWSFWVSPHRLPPSLPQPAHGVEHLPVGCRWAPLKGMDRVIRKPVAGAIDLNWWPIKIENSRKLSKITYRSCRSSSGTFWGKRRWTNEANKVQNARLTGSPMSMSSLETSRNAPTLTQSGKRLAGQPSGGQSGQSPCQKSAAAWSSPFESVWSMSLLSQSYQQSETVHFPEKVSLLPQKEEPFLEYDFLCFRILQVPLAC